MDNKNTGYRNEEDGRASSRAPSLAPSFPALRGPSPSRGFSRALSVPPLSSTLRGLSVPSFPTRDSRARSLIPDTALSPLDLLSEYERDPLLPRGLSPTPVKYGRWGPRSSEVAYDKDGLPVFRGGWPRWGSLDRLVKPRALLPESALRDPFWFDLGLRPFESRLLPSTPAFMRESYLSPVKRRYLWSPHPIRPLAHIR